MSRFRSKNPTRKICPHCGSTTITKRVAQKEGYHCNKCRKDFKHPKVVRTIWLKVEAGKTALPT